MVSQICLLPVPICNWKVLCTHYCVLGQVDSGYPKRNVSICSKLRFLEHATQTVYCWKISTKCAHATCLINPNRNQQSRIRNSYLLFENVSTCSVFLNLSRSSLYMYYLIGSRHTIYLVCWLVKILHFDCILPRSCLLSRISVISPNTLFCRKIFFSSFFQFYLLFVEFGWFGTPRIALLFYIWDMVMVRVENIIHKGITALGGIIFQIIIVVVILFWAYTRSGN